MADPKQLRFLWWVGGIVLALLLLVVHPWLLGVPGRIAELRFKHAVREGMSRAEVAALAKSTRGDCCFLAPQIEPNTGPMEIDYTEWWTSCVRGGTTYLLDFDQHDRFRSWHAQPWKLGC